MGHSNVNLAGLIGSRICHDLVSPIGAISNGIELIGMAGGTSGPEMELISDSAGNASARIRFFRVAYGAPGAQEMARGEIDAILRGVTRGGRIEMRWHPAEAQSRAAVRRAFLALQCCETALAHGGRIDIRLAEGEWQVEGRAQKLRLDEGLWTDLAEGCPGRTVPITPALVQFALLADALREAGRALSVATGPEGVTLRF